jgi:hypothetical protein
MDADDDGPLDAWDEVDVGSYGAFDAPSESPPTGTAAVNDANRVPSAPAAPPSGPAATASTHAPAIGRVGALVRASSVAMEGLREYREVHAFLADGAYPAAIAGRGKGNGEARRELARRANTNYRLIAVDGNGPPALHRTQTQTRNTMLIGAEWREARFRCSPAAGRARADRTCPMW